MNKFYALVFCFLALGSAAIAQENPPPPPPPGDGNGPDPVPVDGGASILLAVGAVYASRKMGKTKFVTLAKK
jgi:hypothetical protein